MKIYCKEMCTVVVGISLLVGPHTGFLTSRETGSPASLPSDVRILAALRGDLGPGDITSTPTACGPDC